MVKLKEPKALVAESPVNPITSAGAIAPTLDVAASPVNGTPVPTIIDPTEDVAESPVNGIPIPIIIDPTEDVAESPVSPITSEGVIVPTVEVAATPLIRTVRPDSPQFSVPHVSEPQPNSLKGITVPSVVDNCVGAVRVTSI